MIQRVKLSDRKLPNYSVCEELVNALTHGLGAAFGAVALVLCLLKASTGLELTAAAIYGVCTVVLYSVSSVYHGLRPGMAKKVLQVIDHCTIYLLIAGSYTVVSLTALQPHYPALAWGLVAFQWILAAIAITLTAIDLRAFRVFSMICYIGMGWAIVPFIREIRFVLGLRGFYYLLWGGLAFTAGAVLYGLGSKVRWFHSLFHIFVLLGSILQFIAIYFYAI